MMWVLLAMGLAGTLIFIERLLYLHRGQIRSTAFVNGIRNILAKRRLMEALTVCEETPGPVAAVVKSALLHADCDEQEMRLAVQEAALIEIPVLERRLGSIAAIAQVAPLVGLLGTLLGMITTFHAFMQGEATPRPTPWRRACGRRCSAPRAAWSWPSPGIWPTISSAAGSGRSCGTWSGAATRS